MHVKTLRIGRDQFLHRGDEVRLMSDKILPATDAEVTELKGCLVRFDAGEVTLGGPQFASGCERLIARIEADRTTIRAKDEEIERLRKVRAGSAVTRLHNLCDQFEEMDKRQEALIAELVSALEALTDSAVTDSDACSICLHGVPMHIAGCAKVHALAVLAKAKEAGQ